MLRAAGCARRRKSAPAAATRKAVRTGLQSPQARFPGIANAEDAILLRLMFATSSTVAGRFQASLIHCGVPAKFIAEGTQLRPAVDAEAFQFCDFCEILKVLDGKGLAEARMVGAAGINPGRSR